MNTRLSLLSYLFLPLLLLGLVACDDDDDMMDSQNIVELASDDEDLSILVDALAEADLATTLEGDGPFTVFAPTNTAFQALLDSNDDWNTLQDIPGDLLEDVLLFHVLGGEFASTDLNNSYITTFSTAFDEQVVLQVDVNGGVTFNGSAEPIVTDIDANNGLVHKIDEVMLPPNIVDLASNNDNFSSLVAALTDSRHTTDFVSLLTGTGPYTVFAPTNAAFQALLDSNDDWDSLADIDIATLEAVLTYHVVDGANVQSDQLTDDQSITTLGGDLTTDLSDGAKLETTSGQSVDITLTDVQGTNGVIHVVDEVLLP